MGENEIIQKAKQGDHQALEVLFRRHVEGAVRLAYLITRNWAAAEDAVQEAFLQAFRSLGSFREERPFQPWFSKIVVNKAKRSRTRRDRDHLPYCQEQANPHRIFKPEERALEKEELAALFRAIAQLDDKYKLPLVLKYLSGLSEAQTAAALGVPLSTVKSRLYVARQRLKKYLSEKDGSEHHDF